ncbi:RNA-guided endonuclease InsQ/TnpB family protein [Prochlorothrix hollandica]|uniref:Transposase n=1 Tax=Prochlorothrix hollandica PCC 9006 = CALU 1027 TaxID=317619 RepID=A0A0M2PWL1_PROHO|nr:RNA-guided endonuclease TnpB family protein [Prochlorothrix hollandica]KKI99477.1 transposase [Prochlorothrix hollandica PCC 9006 = CALU 1027]
MITLTYEYKLKPTKQQVEQIDHDLEVCRRVWNYALKERKDWIASRKCPVNACSLRSEYIIPADEPYPSFSVQCQRLTEAKRLNTDLASVNAQVLQQILRRLDQAFDRRKKLGFGFPRFKKPGQMRSFSFPQLGKMPLKNGSVQLPGLGWMAIRQSRHYPEGFAVKQARVVKRASGYYVMLTFQADIVIPDPPLVGHVVGVDVGLEYFLSTSDRLQLERPKFFVDLQRKLKSLQRRLKRKQIGSANWKKAQLKVSRLYEHIANARKDFHFKVAHQLCDVADVIVVEALNLIGLSRGMLGKHMLDAGHGQFLNSVLPWVGFKRGKAVVKEKAAGTSQECPACGEAVRKTLSTRWHECPCGCSMPRDIASSLVLRNRFQQRCGMSSVKNAPGEVLVGSVLHSSQDSVNGESPAIREALAG